MSCYLDTTCSLGGEVRGRCRLTEIDGGQVPRTGARTVTSVCLGRLLAVMALRRHISVPASGQLVKKALAGPAGMAYEGIAVYTYP